jgi:hypothetical protein
LFEIGPLAGPIEEVEEASDCQATGPATGTLSRARMLAAAAPTTRQHPSTRKMIERVNRISVRIDEPAPTVPANGDLIEA